MKVRLVTFARTRQENYAVGRSVLRIRGYLSIDQRIDAMYRELIS